jgi:prevent-host-death family protein
MAGDVEELARRVQKQHYGLTTVRHCRTISGGKETGMDEISANEFRAHLKSEVDRVIEDHRVLRVKRRRGGDFVVVSAEDWSGIEETLYLSGIPGLVESVREAAEEPLEEGTKLEDLEW